MRTWRTPTDRQTTPHLGEGLDRSAADSIRRVIVAGLERYDRQRHLQRLLPLAPEDLLDESVPARRRILARLGRALRAERNRGRAGHWTYDLNRHIALSQAYVAERRLLTPSAAAESNRGPKAHKQGPPPVKPAAIRKTSAIDQDLRRRC